MPELVCECVGVVEVETGVEFEIWWKVVAFAYGRYEDVPGMCTLWNRKGSLGLSEK